jgi:hypothetical protein
VVRLLEYSGAGGFNLASGTKKGKTQGEARRVNKLDNSKSWQYLIDFSLKKIVLCRSENTIYTTGPSS